MFKRVGTALVMGLFLASTFAPGSSIASVTPVADAVHGTVAPPAIDVRGPSVVTTYAGGSTVVEDALYAPTVDVHTSYRALLPAGYDATTRRYPVLYMLHGVAGDSSEWQSIGLLEAADRMMQRGEIDPFIIVLPNGGAKYWVNSPVSGRWADYVVNDVVKQIDREFRTIDDPRARAIGGLSMGGEGALRIALTNPSVFGTAAAHSPSLRTAFDQFAPELQEVFVDEATWRSVTPLWLVVDTDTAYGLNLSIDIGEDDPWRANVELLHERMVSRGIAHRFEVLPGEHAAEYWIDNVDHYLAFYSSALVKSSAYELAPDAM